MRTCYLTIHKCKHINGTFFPKSVRLAGILVSSRSLSSKHQQSSRGPMDLFKSSEHAKLYAAYRPTYPSSVYEKIAEFCKQSGKNEFQKAVDIGCGSGQSSFPLSSYFNHVTGMDVSKSQIAQAKEKYPNLDFRVGPGEDLSLFEDSSVDLVTVAQAFHWIDQSKFYPEVTRVLRPGGALVVYGYGLSVVDNEEIQRHITHFYKEVLKGYWETGRQHVENKYQDFVLPFPGWLRDDSLEIEFDWTLDAIVGYLSSWSAWQKKLQEKADANELVELATKLRKVYPGADTDTALTIRWPIFMLMGHKP